MLAKYKQLPLRTGIGIILLNSKNKVFVGKRIDNPNKYWQMPQGGVDKNENYLEAAHRELEEETSIINTKLLKEIDKWFTYELPDGLIEKVWKGKYKGQKQKWFIMRFVGNEEEINIKTKKPEFKEWKWIDINQLTNIVVKFKVELYKEIVRELKYFLN